MTIPFDVPARFLAQVSAGDLVRYGALLKDPSTGQIVAHLQESGKVFSAVSGLANPVGAAGSIIGTLDGAYQNRMIRNTLDNMQTMMGGMQVVGLANLAASVVGIGVTVASTLIILSRMNAINGKLGSVSNQLDGLPTEIEEGDLRRRIVDVQTALERFAERETRNDMTGVVAEVERKLHEAHNQFAAALERMAHCPQSNPDLIAALIQGLLLSSASGSRALLAADEIETAKDRCARQAERFQSIFWEWPEDAIAARLSGTDKHRTEVAALFKEGLAKQSTQPTLFETLLQKGYKGSDYLRSAQEEHAEPILLLPV